MLATYALAKVNLIIDTDAGADVDDIGAVETRCEIGEIGDILVPVGGVDHEQILVVGHLVDQGVVDESAFGIHDAGVLDATDGHLLVVVARYQLHEIQRGRATDHDLAHV